MKFYDRNTGIYIADSNEDLLACTAVSYGEIKDLLSGYILSVSGWRALFARSKDENDHDADVGDGDRIIAAAAASAFFSYLSKDHPRILIGSDTRPTWRMLTAIAARILIALGADVDLLGIASAPEIMAYSSSGYDGFLYVSASHNPIGHNGFKFGVSGGVLESVEEEKVKNIFLSCMDDGIAERMRRLSASVSEESYRAVLKHHETVKRRALRHYSSFVLHTAHADDDAMIPFGIVVDFNGSARSASIDIPFLRSHGADVMALNSVPGQIVHGIIPEGCNLDDARKALERAHRGNHRFILGYAPDNDGDRGNFVYIARNGKACALSAQEGFALVSSIELAHAVMMHPGKRVAIAVNGPTSLLLDDIASRLGAEVFRSDIGEANVVSLADRLRREGCSVPICGEGSNGGCIVYPAKVRDPMNSLMAIAKLWSVPGLYGFLMKALGKKSKAISIDVVLSAFPEYLMTPSSSPAAVLNIRSRDWPMMKREYARIAEAEADANMPECAVRYEIREYEGSDEIVSPYVVGTPTGGVKLQFLSADSAPVAYIWLSRSRTEPVCRIMACVKGGNMAIHDHLLAWQRSMEERADRVVF